MKAPFLTTTLSVAMLSMMFSCTRSADLDLPAHLISKVGQNHLGKPVPALSAAQRSDFVLFMIQVGRVEAASQMMFAATQSTGQSKFVNAPLISTGSGNASRNGNGTSGGATQGTGTADAPTTSADPKTVALATELDKNCKVDLKDDSESGRADGFTINLTLSNATSAQTCPATLNVGFASAKQASGDIAFSMTSGIELSTPDLQNLNDVMKQNYTGSGTITKSGPTTDLVQATDFTATGTITSVTRGSVSVIRTIKAKRHFDRNVMDLAQFEETNEFAFSGDNHLVLLQMVFTKLKNRSGYREYFINGDTISEQEYRQFINNWGIQSKVGSKL